MNLLEHEGKSLFRRHGLPVPRSKLARTPSEAATAAAELGGRAVIKAQLEKGGRGKAGLVRFASSPEEARSAAADMMGRTAGPEIDLVLIEEHLDIASELYVAIRMDDVLGLPVLLASRHGGIDIEGHADMVQSEPICLLRGLRRHHIGAVWRRAGIAGRELRMLTDITLNLWSAFRASDAELLEINPLVIDQQGCFWAADAKAVIDGNALRRQTQLAERMSALSGSKLERLAARLGVNSLVELAGSVAVISTGASFGMHVIDRLGDCGVPAANFMDMGGQSGIDARARIVEVMAAHARDTSSIKAVLIALIQTSKPIGGLIEALHSAFSTVETRCPVVCWIGAAHVATSELSLSDARARLESAGILTFGDLDGALHAVAGAARQ